MWPGLRYLAWKNVLHRLYAFHFISRFGARSISTSKCSNILEHIGASGPNWCWETESGANRVLRFALFLLFNMVKTLKVNTDFWLNLLKKTHVRSCQHNWSQGDPWYLHSVKVLTRFTWIYILFIFSLNSSMFLLLRKIDKIRPCFKKERTF